MAAAAAAAAVALLLASRQLLFCKMGKLGKRKRQRLEQRALLAKQLAAAGRGRVDDCDEEEEKEDASTVDEQPLGDERLAQLDVSAGVSAEDLAATIRVVTALGKDLSAFKTRMFKPLRAAMHPIIEEQMKSYGAKPGRKRGRAGSLGAQCLTADEELKKRDLELINSRQLRAARLKRLEEMGTEGQNEAEGKELAWRVPDGVALEDGKDEEGRQLLLGYRGAAVEEGQEQERADDLQQLAVRTPARVRSGACVAPVDHAAALPEGSTARLHNPISCYTCKKSFRELHPFYDQLCPACAALNYAKRRQTANLEGKVGIVTGARVKIGYRCALKLLRCGAVVVATSRFPQDTANRYAAEHDFDEWKGRIHIYGLDFRDVQSLERFIVHIKSQYGRLDMLINNACQTIRRPPAYYAPQVAIERSEPVAATVPMLSNFRALEADGTRVRMLTDSEPGVTTTSAAAAVVAPITLLEQSAPAASGRPAQSAELSQVPVAPGDLNRSAVFFPSERDALTGSTVAALDVNGQQVDLRRHNSWLAKLEDVSTAEVAEVLVINTLAPFVLNGKLRPLMERTAPGAWKFIVNVSAMEGKFYRYKTANHPHTNMAKAALNMMTRTSAEDYRKANIYMTAVDTGWINDEKPLDRAGAHAKKGFQTPLDEVDAAARILDPILSPLASLEMASRQDEAKEAAAAVPEPPWGVFLKDYVKCEW
jgi:NAD(P)-dependent dehydrogenase (short-subunit alcohol dehydrogenase family)